MGLERLTDLFAGNRILERQAINEKLGYTISWYKYLQIQHFLCSAPVLSARSRQKSTFELLLLKRGMGYRGVLSTIYKTLVEAGSTGPTTYQKLWEKDGVVFDPGTWNFIWSRFPFRSSTVAIEWQTVKFLMRWYMTPVRLHKISKDISPLCVKSCKERANYLHNWWSCNTIKTFWESIQMEITRITGFDVPLTIEFCLLNVHPEGLQDIAKAETIGILLTVAKAAIALKWRDEKPPSLSLWQSKLLEHFILSKLDFSRSSTYSTKVFENFMAVWLPILEYLNSCDRLSGPEIYKSLLYF